MGKALLLLLISDCNDEYVYIHQHFFVWEEKKTLLIVNSECIRDLKNVFCMLCFRDLLHY